MAINQLQREAFLAAPGFVSQVNGVVTQEAMYKAETWANLTPEHKRQLAHIAKFPWEYGFVSTIISAEAWNSGYDVWAANPGSLRPDIASAVGHWWEFCTGMVNAEPAPPEEPEEEPT